MPKTLIVAEKPSVGQDYAKALGDRFAKHDGYLESDERIVSWAIGHLVELAEPEDYDPELKRWTMKTLPVLPEQFKLKPDARGKKQYDVLRKLLRRDDVDAVVNGCDAGREGELIFAYIYDKAGARKPVRRLWVNSMTRGAIRDGFEALRDGAEMRPLEAAARSRSEADWLVGMNATRAATVRGRALGGVVSLGRVQTPTLALIVRRDLEIDAFEPETYFQVDARFELDEGRGYRGRWFDGKRDRVGERERADAVATAARGKPAVVEAVKKTERRQRSPLLYDLTSLQRDANSRYGISASRTLQAAQRLYEGSSAGAVITYPRTRSQFLPSDQSGALKGIAAALGGIAAYAEAARYVASLDVLPLGRVINDGKVDDHHAIIPTGELPTKPLTGDDSRVFDLVARRYLSVFHPDAVFEDTDVVTEAGGERFRTHGRRLIVPGWRAAAFGDQAAEEPGQGDDDAAQVLPRIDEGERGRCADAEVLEKQTKPPPRYSEASLLRHMETAGREIEDEELRDAMKDSGLGTPATRAETIEKLLRVGYIERLSRQLRATSKGRQVIGLLADHALTSAELTGSWEKRLTEIERGGESRDAFMADIRAFTTQVVEYFRDLTAEEVRAQRAEIGPCPNGDGVIRENRLAYGCSSWKSKEEPGCGFVIWKQQKGRSISPAEARDLLEHGRTELLDGFKTRPSRGRLVLAEGNKVHLVAEDGTRLDAPAGPREVIAECPKCAADGNHNEIRENSRAYGCSSWKSRKEPGCGFVIWKSQKGRQITADDARQVIRDGATDWLEFRDRKGPFRGRLVLTPEQTVELEREDERAGSQPDAATQAA